MRSRGIFQSLLRRLFWPPRRTAGVLVMLAILWRVARWAAGFPLWGDESFVAVNFLTRGYAEMMRGLDHAQVVPIGFLWATLAVSKVLGASEQALRLIPTLSGLLALVLLWRWAPRVLPRRQAWIGIAIFAASYYPTRHANEVKPYAVDLLVALVLTVLAWWCWQNVRETRRWAVLALAGGLGIWFSYPSTFVTAGAGLALLGKVVSDRETRRAVVPWAGLCCVAAVFAANAAWMWRVVGAGQSLANEGLRTSNHWALAFPPGAGDTPGQWLLWPVRLVWWAFQVHTGNMFAYPMGGKNYASSLTLVIVVVGIAALWRRRHPLLPLLLLPTLMCLIAAALRLYPYGSSARTTLFLAPGICLLAGVGAVTAMQSLFRPRTAVKGIRGIAFLLLLIIVGGSVRDIRKPHKHPSDRICRTTIRTQSDLVKPGEHWIVVGAMHDTPWAPNMIGWGGSAARTRHYLIYEAHRHDLDLDFAPDPGTLHPGKGPTVLIVYRDNKHGTDYAFPTQQVEAYLESAEVGLGKPASVKECPLGIAQETLWFYTYLPAG